MIPGLDNIYTWWSAIQSAEGARESLFVRRNSWGPGTVAQIVRTEPEWAEWRKRPSPYFGNPKVFGWVHWSSSGRYRLVEISCPGTFGYFRVERPSWWDPPMR